MKSIIMRITLFTMLLLILFILSAYGATERRTALVIGNSSYTTGSLRNPVNDADDMASTLKRLGFDVILKKNATQQGMEDAIRELGDRLKKGGVGLFFYAGHGVQVAGRNYLIPLGVRIDRETDVKYRAVDAGMVLDEMGNAGNSMNIVILDACRDNPFGKSFRSSSRGLAIISSAPRGTLVSYSTGPGSVAADGGGRNSPYTGSLMKHMMTPRLPIEEVFKSVRQDLGRQTGGKQIPWELSSLEGRFYFNAQAGGGSNITAESKRLDAELQRIAQERELLEKQRALDEEREKLEALKHEQAKPSRPVVEKKEVAMGPRPSVTGPGETGRDARLTAPCITTAPTINGVVDFSEWSMASSYNLDFINSAGDLKPTTWYFMNDGSYLYIGVKTSTTAHWDTIAGFGIDGNNDNYASGNPAGPHQDFTVGQASNIGWSRHTSYVVYSGGGTANHVRPPSDLKRATYGSSGVSYEFKIPISALNMASDTIAIRFWLLQGGLHLSRYQFFYPRYTTGPAWETVAQWPRLTLE